MASVDAFKSVYETSDEIIDHVCGPCKTRGNIIEAKKYCSDCPEYLCDSCGDYHQALAITKSHTIVSADTASSGPNRQLTIYCEWNKSQGVEFYCQTHAGVICRQCQSFKHHRCITTPIQHKSSDYTSSMLTSTLSKTKNLKDKYEQLKLKCNQDKKDLDVSKEDCKKEIRAFRKELDDFLDKLERKMIAELDQSETKLRERIDKQIATLTTALQILEADYELLTTAKNDARKHVMFAVDTQISKRFQECESRMLELEKEAITLRIAFEKNKHIDYFLNDTNSLGSLNILERASQTRNDKADLLRRQIQSQRSVAVKIASDKKEPYLTGCAVMSNGYVVLCDHGNSKLKLLDPSLTLKDSLDLTGFPWDVSVVDDNNVIVTLCMNYELQNIKIFPKMQKGHVFDVNKPCFGVAVHVDEIFVSCHNCPGQGEVIVLDNQNGNIKRRIGAMLSQPSYIALNRTGDKIFVSDSNNNTVTCRKLNGDAIYIYKSENLKRPRGLCCDDNDNVMVCNYHSDNVHIIGGGGTKTGIIVPAKDGLKDCYSITFRETDKTFFVGSIELNMYSLKP